ncbi:hypothetical protein M0R45_013728 [Rubus argutus]|uniref:F-box domain-containing protein n=1 Tax=Rubus argutus TaxID=59490 RepID=A0AAW1XJC7_RUBAR
MEKSSYETTQEFSGKQKQSCRNWLDLPEDITGSILSRLRAIDILENAQLVCKTWLKMCKVNPLVWRTIDMDNDMLEDFYYGSLESMCHDLIDRSCGSLVKINVVRFGTNSLLKYITDSSSCGIRHLRLEKCRWITDEGLCAVASKFARLVELDISECSMISYKTLEVVGRSCPLLISLKWKFGFYDKGSNSMDYGDSIARTMHGLHHLSLSGFKLTNEELRNILESCPHLETLDLGESFLPNLEQDLGRRCVEQITRKLRLPFDCFHQIQH